MAHLLAKLGKEALKPKKVGDVWHKPVISRKTLAKLRKSFLNDGKEWEFDEPVKEKVVRAPKGHKVDRLKVIKDEEIAAKMASMQKTVDEYRKNKKNVAVSAIDLLTLTSKQIRAKNRGT